MAAPLARYTPSLLPRATLEAIFVVRRPLLDRIGDRIRAAASSPSRNHTLLVGPRGSGKTHLMSLAYYNTLDLIAEGARLQAAWLPEDPWGIVSYRHLLAAILERVLTDDEPTPSHRDSEDDLEARLISASEAGGPIVVFLENLAQILGQIDDLGQQRLRHLLQAHGSLLLIATTTRLDRTLADQAAPFYGFFSITRLEPFTPDQATDMMTAIAAHRGDDALATWLRSPDGKKRVRAIAHLAGGQPRLWAAMVESLSINDVGHLIDHLLTKFDDLTPYYQEQLARLSPHQRLIVIELAEADHPLHIADLADRLGLDQRSVGKSVSDLADRGWIAPIDTPVADLLDRRRTYYELVDPLARVTFQLKNTRGEPIRLVLDFLTAFFDPEQISSARTAAAFETQLEPYSEAAQQLLDTDPIRATVRRLTRLPASRVSCVEQLGRIDDALNALKLDDPNPFLQLPTPLRLALEEHLATTTTRNEDIRTLQLAVHRLAADEMGDVPHPQSESWLARSANLLANTPTDADALAQHVQWLILCWRFPEAEATLLTLDTLRGPDHPDTLTSRNNLAYAYESAGDLGRAIPLYEQNLTDTERILGPDHPDTLTSRNNLASVWWDAGRHSDALAAFEEAVASSLRLFGPHHTLSRRLIENRDTVSELLNKRARPDETP